MDTVWQDLRFGLSLMARHKAYTFVVVLTLAVCIGANAAIFGYFHAIVRGTFPYPESDRLAYIGTRWTKVDELLHGVSTPNFIDIEERAGSFESMGLIHRQSFSVQLDGGPLHVEGARISPAVFEILGVPPLHGRVFSAPEAEAGSERVAVLSHGWWQSMFGGDPSVVGREIRVDREVFVVVGVMPRDFFALWREAELWVPFVVPPTPPWPQARLDVCCDLIGRLKPGATIARADAELSAIFEQVRQAAPAIAHIFEEFQFGFGVMDLTTKMIREEFGWLRNKIYLFQGAVAFVLLIGCVNVASLMISRGTSRLKEVAVRHSLGASHGRLGRQILTETLLLFLLGGLLGLGVGALFIRLLQSLSFADNPFGQAIGLDGPVLLFTLAVSAATGLLFGLIPVLQMTRSNLSNVVQESSKAVSSNRRGNLIQGGLVVFETGVSFILLAGALLMVRSFVKILDVDPGFEKQNLLSASVALPASSYAETWQRKEFRARALQDLAAIPGVEGAAAVSPLPFVDEKYPIAYTIEGFEYTDGAILPTAPYYAVTPGYFEVMNIPLLRGRLLAQSDTAESQRVVLIDEQLAERRYPGEDPIGRRIMLADARVSADKPWYTIVGIVGDTRHDDLTGPDRSGAIYTAFEQDDEHESSLTFAIKTSGLEEAVVPAVRAKMAAIDSDLPLQNVATMATWIDAASGNQKNQMLFLGLFASLALILAAIGLYSVLSFIVGQRVKEIGIRMALGAPRQSILGMVLSRGLKWVATGVVLGLVGAILLARFIANLHYQVENRDPWTYGLVAAVLLSVALIASILPAIRGSRIHPMEVIRE